MDSCSALPTILPMPAAHSTVRKGTTLAVAGTVLSTSAERRHATRTRQGPSYTSAPLAHSSPGAPSRTDRLQRVAAAHNAQLAHKGGAVAQQAGGHNLKAARARGERVGVTDMHHTL